MGAITAWSYSRWETYYKCPQLAKFKFIDKLEEPGSEVLERGIAVHKDLELYLVGEKDNPDTSLRPNVAEYYDNLRHTEVFVENEIAFDSQWRRVGWFDKGENGAWCRVKKDAFVPAEEEGGETVVVDHKTGGYKNGKLRDPNKYDLQMELYGLSALLLVPWASTARADLVFVDGDVILQQWYKRGEVEPMKRTWNKRVAKMLADEKFAPNPGDACRFCHFRKDNGGPCQY